MVLWAASDGQATMLSESLPCARRPLFALSVCLTILTVTDGRKKRQQRTRNHRLLLLLVSRRRMRIAGLLVFPHSKILRATGETRRKLAGFFRGEGGFPLTILTVAGGRKKRRHRTQNNLLLVLFKRRQRRRVAGAFVLTL